MSAVEQQHRVVITGVGALSNLGFTEPETWSGMLEGRSGITTIQDPQFDHYDGWAVTIAGSIKDWDPSTKIEKRALKRLDRCTQLGLYAAEEAIAQSGLDLSTGDFTRRGVVIGSGVGGISSIEQNVITLREKGPSRINPFTVPRLMVNAVSGNLSIRHNLQGPASAHATACASSGHAIGDAMGYIRRGEADVMLAGGSEASVTPLCIGAFMTMKALSTRNDEPTKACRPFDVDRDGFIMSEGSAIYMLESEAHAKARGATILGELVGFGNSCDAYHITGTDPNGLGASRAMKGAMRDAGLNTEDIGYVNAHGTSTPIGDVSEVAAAINVFGDHARKSAGGPLRMSSTKSTHGHALGASGAIEMVACLHACRDGVLPPTINLQTPGTRNEDGSITEFDLNFVPNVAEEHRIKWAMNNTFGFGGHNVTLIVGAYQG
ncbi:MAG: 3-oxoacyl-[acyl-carrier-protein] synthase II [Phycisphaerales bacterium]|jgi:3-oxoacyl-[acyl-carrier-protein] synthase II